MEYTNSEKEFVFNMIDKQWIECVNKSFILFEKWWNDEQQEFKETLINQLMLTITPSIILQQFIRLEMIEYLKEVWKDYPIILEKINFIK